MNAEQRSNMILVTGATGNAGSQVVRALLEAGQDVRAFVRDADSAYALFGEAVEPAPGDFADRRSVRAALDGVEAVFLSGADDPRRVEWETAAIDAAVAAGVPRIVKLSSIAAEPGAPVAFWDWHGRVERHLRRSGIDAVVLRSSVYMSNLFAGAEQVAGEGRLYAPAGDARIAMIDPRDVGAAAAAVLTTAGHDGRTYVLTGPEAITYDRVAAELSAATARHVEYIDVPDEDAKQGMVQAGMPELVAEQVVKVFVMLREGAAEQVTTTVESLTGRAPRDFASFARDHADLFAPAAMGAAR
jgi:uncharacterized protein YbjT (DUF2867 family)